MAAKFDVEEVLMQVLDDDMDRESDEEEEEEGELSETDKVRVEMEKLEKLIDSFDSGERFNSELFRENAKKALLPILCQSFASLQVTGNKKRDCQAASLHLSLRTINVGSVLLDESRIWLNGIYRRLGGKVGVRRPYYGEISRNIPYDLYSALRQVLKDLKAAKPDCYMAGNRKGDVVTITSLDVLECFFSVLSGLCVKDVRPFLKRRLTAGCRFNHQVKILVSPEKDFGLVYKKKIGHLIVQFYYGEWNYHGNPQHFGYLSSLPWLGFGTRIHWSSQSNLY